MTKNFLINNENSDMNFLINCPKKLSVLISAMLINFSFVSSAFAVFYPLMPEKAIIVKVSKHGYTRFSIEGERITDVFIYPQEALQVNIHNQGYLIIVPKQEEEANLQALDSVICANDQPSNCKPPKKQNILITITGEEGTTQDLSLRFTGGEPEPVKFTKLPWQINKQIKEGE